MYTIVFASLFLVYLIATCSLIFTFLRINYLTKAFFGIYQYSVLRVIRFVEISAIWAAVRILNCQHVTQLAEKQFRISLKKEECDLLGTSTAGLTAG